MENPSCPENYILAWREASDMTFFLHCRPLTDVEIESNLYIDELLKLSLYIPIGIVVLICVSYLYSHERIYRIRKNSSQTDDIPF
jgi:hypothetical protein